MATYDVLICRTVRTYGTIAVEADTEFEAENNALAWSDYADYEPSPASHRVMSVKARIEVMLPCDETDPPQAD